MRTFRPWTAIAILALAGCGGGSSASDAGPDAGTDTDADTDACDTTSLDAVDLLVVIENGIGEVDEQPILAQSLFRLASQLLHPAADSGYEAVDDLRIAAITNNMGFSANGESMDEHWPGTVVPTCEGLGDNGEFQDVEVDSVELPDGGAVDCQELAGQWAETSAEAENPDLPAQAACLAVQGNDSCGWDQPLQSAATALTRENQADFVRENALLAIIDFGNEDDCSMEFAWCDGECEEGNPLGLFQEDEIAVETDKINLACGNHPEDMLDIAHFYEIFTGVKANPCQVVLLEITGVPYGDQPGAAACQGPGDQLGDCLDQDEMQLVAEQPNAPGDLTWYFRPVCTREWVTTAWPARRFVELANGYFGADSYVYSVCNEDWSPAFDALGGMIREKLEP